MVAKKKTDVKMTASTTTNRKRRNGWQKYEIPAQMFKMRAIMSRFHSSLHANLLYDLFASKYPFTLGAAATAAVFGFSTLATPFFRPFSIIIVSH